MCAKTTKAEKMSFEQATERLEAIVARMDSPETGLEEMIALTEEGLKLVRNSRKLLADAELRIRQLENPDTEKKRSAAPVPTNNDEFTLL